jgi:hypothetical protein
VDRFWLPWPWQGALGWPWCRTQAVCDRDITNGKILTESGYITCPAEVAEHLRKRVGSAEWTEAHKDKHIHEIYVFYSPHNEIHRPRADHKFDPLDGAKSSFSYMMLAKDQIARRGETCWCNGCLCAHGRSNMTSSGDKLICDQCTHRNKPAWTQQTVKDHGTGLAGHRKEAQEEGKKFAQMLKAPSPAAPNEGFIAIQARERWSTSEEVHNRPGHFWLAQAPDVLEVRRIDRRRTIEGVMFGVGDYLVRIGTTLIVFPATQVD